MMLGEVMFHHKEIGFKTARVADVDVEKVGGAIWTLPRIVTLRMLQPAKRHSFVPFFRWGAKT